MARSRGGLCKITPNGLEFISSRRANKALACGSAVLVRPGVIERIVVPRSALSTPGPARHSLQVSAKLQCARSTVRKLVAVGVLRASRISSRTIRISEVDLQAYLDGRANMSAPAAPSWKSSGVAR